MAGVNLAQLDDVARSGAIDDAAVQIVARHHVALVASILVAACSGGSGGPTPTPPVGSVALPTSTVTAVPSDAATGGLSISSILGGTNAAPASTSWVRITDPAAPFTFEVPSTWTGHAGYPWVEGGQTIGTVLAAGPDPSKLSTDFSVPGIAIGLSANPSGLTAHQVVEADDSYAGTCTPGSVEDTTDSGATASFRLWESCAGGSGFLLVMAIVPADGQGLVAIIFQGATEADLGYVDHIAGSLLAAEASATIGPGATQGGSSGGQPYTITMDYCQNQHGQGIAEGLIRNDDTRYHAFRVVVAFSDLNSVLLNDTWGTTPDVPAGITAKWQAVVPSGLPSVNVTCRITGVELVN